VGSEAVPQGDFFKRGRTEATFVLKPEAGGPKNVDSKTEKNKSYPLQTRHKNATEAEQLFDWEARRPNKGGGGLSRLIVF
jgi:hypothetical protein